MADRTLQLGLIQDLVWDPTRARLIVSSGMDLVVVDPAAPRVEDTLLTGQIASSLALSPNGQYLYASLSGRGVIRRYRMDTRAMDLEIQLGRDAQGRFRDASSMVATSQPERLIVAVNYSNVGGASAFRADGTSLVVFEGATQLPTALPLALRSLYRRPTDGAIFGFGPGQVLRIGLTPTGARIESTAQTRIEFSREGSPTWSPTMLVDRAGYVFDLEANRSLGKLNIAPGCAITPEVKSRSVLAVAGDRNNPRLPVKLVRYSLDRFLPESEIQVNPSAEFLGTCNFLSRVWSFDTDGVAIASYQNSINSNLVLFRAPELTPVATAPAPEPTRDPSGAIHLNLRTNGIVFDSKRNRLWATVPGSEPGVGNSMIGIDPATGRILETYFVGPEPGQIVISADESRIYIMLTGSNSISVFDPELKKVIRDIALETVPRMNLPGAASWITGEMVAVGSHPDRVAVNLYPSTGSYDSVVVAFDKGVLMPRMFNNEGSITTYFSQISPGDTPDSVFGASSSSSIGRAVTRLIVDDQGVRLDRTLNWIKLGTGIRGPFLSYAAGRIYSGEGEIWSADLSTLFGTVPIDQSYATRGVAVPFPELNRLVMVHGSPFTSSSAVTSFELDSWRPVARLPLLNAQVHGLDTVFAIRTGSDSIAIGFYNQIRLVPLGILSPLPLISTVPETVAPGLRRIRLAAHSIAALPGAGRLLVATAGSNGALGNSILMLNPRTGSIEAQMDAGSEPSMLTLSPDGSTAWSLLQGERRVARFDLNARQRNVVFTPLNTNPANPSPVVSMAAAAGGSLGLSYVSGFIQVVDGTQQRPVQECNVPGTPGFAGGSQHLLFADAGDRLYSFQASGGGVPVFRRCHVAADGARWMSNTPNVLASGNESVRLARGLLFNAFGEVYDPERSRLVANYFSTRDFATALLPDPELNRVFYLMTNFGSRNQLLAYDWDSKTRVGQYELPSYNFAILSGLVRLEGNILAFRTATDIYLFDIDAFSPVSNATPPPQPVLPTTPGVKVIPLAANDLAYDPSRNLIYLAVPNYAGVDGDSITAIDPASGEIRSSTPVSLNPRILALTADYSRLYFTHGILTGSSISTGFSPVSDSIQGLNLVTGNLGPSFPKRPATPLSSFIYQDIAPLNGSPQAIGAIENLTQASGGFVFNFGLNSLRIFEDDVSRPDFLDFRSVPCTWLAAGEPGRMYCTNSLDFVRLKVNANGVSRDSQFTYLPGRGPFGRVVYREGRIYTPAGQVIEPETGRTLHRLNTQGQVAVDDRYAYWLDTQAKPQFTLRIYDRITLQPQGTRRILTTSGEPSRLVTCGNGCLAFAAGDLTYIVQAGEN